MAQESNPDPKLSRVQKMMLNIMSNRMKQAITLETGPEGIEYFVIKKGTGILPKKGTKVEVYYMVLNERGSVVDYNLDAQKPFTFKLGGGNVIRGWDEAIPLFPTGSNIVMYVPSDMAYGESGAGDLVPPGSNLYFYIEIVPK
jgi:peptidylprolyl isomerase